VPDIDFTARDFIADPYPAISRALAGPAVVWNDSLAAWCVFPHREVRTAFREPALSSDRIRPFVRARAKDDPDIAYLGDCIGLWMVFNDPPVHTRLRKLVQMAFLPQAIEAMRPTVGTEVDRLIDGLVARGTEADFVRDFAYPLPANVIALMLGVPREGIEQLKAWSDELARFVLTSIADPGKYQPAAAALRGMNGYFARIIAERRARPGDAIIDRLIAAHDGDDLLSLEELLASCVLLLFAGHETTTHFLSSGWRALERHSEQRTQLAQGDGGSALLRNALTEMLRWDGPIVALSRVATADCRIADTAIEAGDRIYLFPAAANRDPAVFAAPDRFDITRGDANRMVTFGFGSHTCLGFHLALLEAEVAWPRLLQRLHGWRMRPHDMDYTTTLVVRGLTRLPIAPA
jgi:cytochrome P450